MDNQNNATPNATKEQAKASFGKKAWWTLAFVAIAALSIWAVVSQTKDFSVSKFIDFVKSADIIWLITAVVSMLGFIFFEAAALLCICNAFGYRQGLRKGFVYSAADIYFSAITPSATGGQPASAFFMIKDGVPGVFVTVALVANLVMYTASIVVMGLFALIFGFGALLEFSAPSVVLIIIGFVAQVALLMFFIMLLVKKGLMKALCSAAIKFLGKLHILRNVDAKLKKMGLWMDEYSKNTSMLKGKSKMLFIVFIFNLLQRLSQTLVTPLTALASGSSFSEAYDLLITQIYVLVGANCVPIPGAMGVTDYLMLDGFKHLGVKDPAFLELFSRSLSFYMCIIICGITVLLSYCTLSKRRKKV